MSLLAVSITDETKKHLADGNSKDLPEFSAFCDLVLKGFSESDWYKRRIPLGPPDRYENAMLKEFAAYLITQMKPDTP